MSVRKIRVLVVDDSAVIRTLLTRLLERDSQIEVVGTAVDPFSARKKIIDLRPDVITLDIEMPRMDGLTFLEKIMAHAPTPTVVFSSLAKHGSQTSMRALELGAVSVLEKPSIRIQDGLDSIIDTIVREVKGAAQSNIKALCDSRTATAKMNAGPAFQSALAETSHKILAIASSTGGTEALKTVLTGLPPDIPGTVIVQHMPPSFTGAFARRLDEYTSFEVREACDGDRLHPGLALLAPGDRHMEIVREGGRYRVSLHDQPTLHGVRPAADYLMKSVAKWAGRNAVGVVLTGMGKDGAEGLRAMRDAGSFNFAQDEKSCVVFGMPKAAISAGAIDRVLPLRSIAGAIVGFLRESEREAI